MGTEQASEAAEALLGRLHGGHILITSGLNQWSPMVKPLMQHRVCQSIALSPSWHAILHPVGHELLPLLVECYRLRLTITQLELYLSVHWLELKPIRLFGMNR